VGFLDIALVQAAVHDAVQAIERRYHPYFYAPAEQGAGSTDAAVAAAAHRLLVLLYPAKAAALDAIYNDYLANHGLAGDSGLAVGEASAAALFTKYRALVPTAPFVGGAGPGEWRPIAPNTAGAFQTLALTEPYTLDSISQFRPPPPPPLTSMPYVRDYNEVKAAGSAAAYPNGHTAVSDFWTTDPLPRWNGGMRGLTANNDVGETARLFALANLAAADALMAVFEAKYHYNFWRPVTAIRNDDGNPKTASDAGWTAYIANPNYPDYPSGMNGVSGAFTETMRLFFGTDDVALSLSGPSGTRQYASLSQAAQEVVDVRVLEGIHFRFTDEEGRRLGERVAHWTFQKVLRADQGKDEGVAVEWQVEDSAP
jgi:hypothetical protein